MLVMFLKLEKYHVIWISRHSYEIGDTRTDYYENENKLTENERKIKTKQKITRKKIKMTN